MKHLAELTAFIICLLEALNLPVLALKVIQPRFIQAENYTATLQCDYNSTGNAAFQQFRINVYKGEIDNDFCAFFFNTTVNDVEVSNCQGRSRNGSVSITLRGLNTSLSDLYICEIEILHPPPYIKGAGNGTYIFISPDVPEVKPCGQFTPITLIALVLTAIFMLYSVVITCLHWMLKKDQEDQSNEYVNMEPPKHSSGKKRGKHIGHRT
ncbi:cytotoxic T-lymphocyte protein 4-like isoform X2 [Mustelus asterias]